MSNITQTDLIKANIEYGGRGANNKTITQNILQEWRNSEKILDMIEAEKYFQIKNTAIEKKTRSYKDPESEQLVVNNTLSNAKSKTGKYRKLVNLRQNFSLDKPFIISCDDDNYKEAWEEFLDEDTRDIITLIGKQAINKGICFAYPFIKEDGNLALMNTQSETIYPAWADINHKELDAIVRDYVVKEYINQTPTDVYKVEYWDRKIFQKFIDYGQGKGYGNLLDENVENTETGERVSVIYTHMQNGKGEGVSWDKVPFIPFKGTEDELPALNECKSNIDNYDLIKSKGIDSILDDIDAVLMVKNISPELNELAKARKIIQNSRIVSVDGDGDAKYLTVNLDITAVIEQLDILKKDIIDDTNTVDVTTIEFGSNPSGKAMRMFFEPLNEWCNGFEKQFRAFMKALKYFFDKWLSWKGGYGSFEELQKKKITFTLDRDLIVDESDIIDNLVKLDDELSQETKDELNPYVESHEKEEKRREEDLKKQQEQMELFQFENQVDKSNNFNNENVDNVDNSAENNQENNKKEDKKA